jgi:hypothetical protein
MIIAVDGFIPFLNLEAVMMNFNQCLRIITKSNHTSPHYIASGHIPLSLILRINNTPNTSLPNLIPRLALATPSAKNDFHRALPAADGFVFAWLVRAIFVDWRPQEGYASRELVRPR